MASKFKKKNTHLVGVQKFLSPEESQRNKISMVLVRNRSCVTATNSLKFDERYSRMTLIFVFKTFSNLHSPHLRSY